MAGPACVIPRQSVHLYQLCRDGKWEEALTYQGKLWDINRVFQKYNLASCIKACLEIQGFEVGDPILPVKPVNDQGKEELKKVLAELEKI